MQEEFLLQEMQAYEKEDTIKGASCKIRTVDRWIAFFNRNSTEPTSRQSIKFVVLLLLVSDFSSASILLQLQNSCFNKELC